MSTRRSRRVFMNNEADGDLGFTYRTRKSGEVQVMHRGRLAATLRGTQALDFIGEVQAGSEADAQQLMARITGNYKRGNERAASAHPRNRVAGKRT
jgi:cytochrome c-type biogenesis protein CcmE